MKLAASQALYGYWNTLRGARCAPEAHDLDPAAMRGVLAHTFMLDIEAADVATRRCRIGTSGTRVDALFGRSLGGAAFASLWAPADRDALSSLLDDVLATARPAVAGFAGAPDGDARTSFELLLLPLRHDGRTHARVLCSLVPLGTPAWIGLRRLTTLSLTTWRMIEPESGGVAGAAGFATQRAPGLRREPFVVHQGGRLGAPIFRPVQAPINRSVRRSGVTLLSTVVHDPAAPARSQT